MSDVADRRVDDADRATEGDAKQPAVSALSPGDAVEASLPRALARAADASRFDVVVQLAKELEARRLARAGNVLLFGREHAKRKPSR